MVIRKGIRATHELEIEDTKMKQLQTFKYSERVFTKYGKCKNKIRERVEIEKGAF